MLDQLHLHRPSRWWTIALPAGIATILICCLACVLLAMAVGAADDLVIDRDRNLATSVIERAVRDIGSNQEIVTVWDDAVVRLHGPLNVDWIDDNLGTWMNRYFGYERMALLDPQDEPIYASNDGKSVDPGTFEDIEQIVRPMIAQVRRMLVTGNWTSSDSAIRSPGAQDIVVIAGRPAMLSVKPVVPSTDKVWQAPQNAYVHISVHYLDTAFVDELRNRYKLENARFSWQSDVRSDELSFALLDRHGKAIGFLLWTPRLPGQLLLGRMVPVLGIVVLAISVVVAILVGGLRKGERALIDSEASARHLAYHDVLTGLPNRASFNERLDLLITSGAATLLLLDLDGFKKINDTFGHPAGDTLLSEVAKRLRRSVPNSAQVARLGGDEFAILLDTQDGKGATRIADTVIAEIDRTFEVENQQLRVGISIGVASMADGETSEDLVRRADRALYRAKATRSDPSLMGYDNAA